MKIIILVIIVLIHTVANSQTVDKTFQLSTWSKSPFTAPQADGLLDQLMQTAFKRCCDLKVKITTNPAERSLKLVDVGYYDGELPRIDNISGSSNNYTNLVQVHEAILPSIFVAFSKDPEINITQWNDVEPYDVGIVIGWKILERNIHKYRSLTKLSDEKSLLALLEKERINVAILTRLVGLSVIHEMKLQNIYGANSTGFITNKDKWYLYLHHKHKALVPKLEKVLHEMKTDGSFARIYCQVLPKHLPAEDASQVIASVLKAIDVKNFDHCVSNDDR